MHIPVHLTTLNVNCSNVPTSPCPVHYHTAEEEIELGPACWLWDYLRRSGMSGYFLALSGGSDSAAVACIVFSMCRLVYDSCQKGDPIVLADLRRILCKDDKYVPASPQEIAGEIFYTCYMGTTNSSEQTNQLSCGLASQVSGRRRTDFLKGQWTENERREI